MNELTTELRQGLLALDTPTVCNALEVVNPDRRTCGFNIRPFVCIRPEQPPILGYARTVRIRAAHKPGQRFDADAYYSYVAEGGPVPSIAVIEDLDDTPGYGAFWGEVNTNIHYGLGCHGVVTNGSVRDIPDSQANFQMLAGMVNPAHAWVNVVDWGLPVNVHGMEVTHDDLIHADQHGAVVIPLEAAPAVIEAAETIMAKERIVIDASQKPGFNMQKLREAWKGMAEIH
ncbi:MAG: RraA family protein [Gammaproteobacteria bacterium]|jgi:regulator of RNase E activity RraA|nr:RraA family protein [Gammaproteobacteria bacterium]MBT4491766.1 RraA family protein [Gammaproteobacteria bacterium]MBT7371585.1 RraA family protein [Gammaproteobacteria bacterium]